MHMSVGASSASYECSSMCVHMSVGASSASYECSSMCVHMSVGASSASYECSSMCVPYEVLASELRVERVSSMCVRVMRVCVSRIDWPVGRERSECPCLMVLLDVCFGEERRWGASYLPFFFAYLPACNWHT